MVIYPAIDIKDGKCVRLTQGRFDRQTVYSEDPVEVAKKWAKLGARFLHVVDLDAAASGESKNIEVIRDIVSSVKIPVQLGGGIRSMEKIEFFLEKVGIWRVIIGTAAVENPQLMEQATRKYNDRIAVGIDARGGKVAVRGWMKESNIDAVELGKKMKSMGVSTIIYTDITRDGTLVGPNIDAIKRMITETGVNIIASGGISKPGDVKAVKDVGAAGVIIGKALYAGKISLAEALKFEEE